MVSDRLWFGRAVTEHKYIFFFFFFFFFLHVSLYAPYATNHALSPSFHSPAGILRHTNTDTEYLALYRAAKRIVGPEAKGNLVPLLQFCK